MSALYTDWAIWLDYQRRGYCVLWALSGMPAAEADLDAVEALRLPYGAAVLQIDVPLGVAQVDSSVCSQGRAAFFHPDGEGPLTIGAVAMVLLGEAGGLMALAPVTPPVSTPGPGWTATISLTLVYLNPESL